ncbi:MAG: RluA family pseudouridine synthase [Endomicrobium sp.]|jgi:23S rRNA pseudouridine955/2504/2580 synthase/23S rRNA pseudouridine1911/1915/1917 synthase|nr:RluA family pseudouridine synthase [Endomicrobium sp.]
MKQQIGIIYQDENILVVNKPSDMLVIPDQHNRENETLVGILKNRLKQKIWVVHRIDRDTTGVLVFAKNPEVHRNISIQFENSKVRKKYIALLSGVLEEGEGTINKPILISGRDVRIDINGKESITNFKVLENFKSYTLVNALPLTGRRHQIRIHFWSLGHPLAIDDEYGTSDPIFLSLLKRNYKIKSGRSEKPLISRLTLHAATLTLTLPGNEDEKTFEAQLPKDFEITIKQLRKYGK